MVEILIQPKSKSDLNQDHSLFKPTCLERVLIAFCLQGKSLQLFWNCVLTKCLYVYICVYRINSLFSHFYMWPKLLVSIHWYLLLVLQNLLQYYGFQCSLFQHSGRLRVRCNHFCQFCLIFHVFVYRSFHFLQLFLLLGWTVQKMKISLFHYLVLPQLFYCSSMCS